MTHSDSYYCVVCVQCIVGHRDWSADDVVYWSYWWRDEPVRCSWLADVCVWCLRCISQGDNSPVLSSFFCTHVLGFCLALWWWSLAIMKGIQHVTIMPQQLADC